MVDKKSDEKLNSFNAMSAFLGFKALPPSAYFHKDMNFKVEVMASSLKKVEDGAFTVWNGGVGEVLSHLCVGCGSLCPMRDRVSDKVCECDRLCECDRVCGYDGVCERQFERCRDKKGGGMTARTLDGNCRTSRERR